MPRSFPKAATPVTFFGYVGYNGCAELRRVERRAIGDTLVWRFVGQGRGGNCIQMPVRLRYTDSVPSQPARTLHIRVDQRDAPVRRTVALPVGAAP